MRSLPSWLEVDPEVRGALDVGRPVVALESSVWAQGLPRPMNLEVAGETCAAIRESGAVPAIVGIRGGKAKLGLNWQDLQELCGRHDVAKVGVGDLPGVLAKGGHGATSVSATLLVAQSAGVDVFATGGVGGVHPNWTRVADISSDVGELSRTHVMTVCSGVKSVLDVPNSVELLETLGVPLALYGTDLFPRFYTSGIRIGIGFRVDTPADAARAHRLAVAALDRGLMVANPAPSEAQIAVEQVEEWLREGMLRAEKERRTGKELTPFLLDFMARVSGGRTLEANRALLIANARLASEIARELSRLDAETP